MKRKNNWRLKRSLSLLLCIFLLLSLAPWTFAEGSKVSSAKEDTHQTTLMFVSDYQHKDGWKDPPETLSLLLSALKDSDIHLDNALICGDYCSTPGTNNYHGAPGPAVGEIKKIFQNYDKDWDADPMIFVQGNHDQMTRDLSEPGLHEYDDYLVYVLNAQTEFPAAQGARKRIKIVKAGAKRLEKCLKSLVKRGENRPVFLASHVPLHFTVRSAKTGDNLYANILFQVINKYGSQLNLVYLYGHNHADGLDSYMGGSCCFRGPGDWLLVPKVKGKKRKTSSYTKQKLKFTYLNTGYTGYFSGSSGESTLTCTVCTIQDDSLTFQRYSEDGPYLLSAQGTESKTDKKKKLIPKKYYGKKRSGSYQLTLRKNTKKKNSK